MNINRQIILSELAHEKLFLSSSWWLSSQKSQWINISELIFKTILVEADILIVLHVY